MYTVNRSAYCGKPERHNHHDWVRCLKSILPPQRSEIRRNRSRHPIGFSDDEDIEDVTWKRRRDILMQITAPTSSRPDTDLITSQHRPHHVPTQTKGSTFVPLQRWINGDDTPSPKGRFGCATETKRSTCWTDLLLLPNGQYPPTRADFERILIIKKATGSMEFPESGSFQFVHPW